MATITQTPDGTYRAQIRKKGHQTISKNFSRKTVAQRWALQIEAEIDRGTYLSPEKAENVTVGEVFEQYEREVAKNKKSYSSDKYRIKMLKQYFGHFSLASLSKSEVSKYREIRLKIRTADSVLKELGILCRVLNFAIDECEIHLPNGNPVQKTKKPERGAGRDRRLANEHEEELLLSAAKIYGGYLPNLIRLALETGMRRGELIRLEWGDIDFKKRVAIARDTKNGEDRRVPLSTRAVDELMLLQRGTQPQIFPISQHAVTRAFSRCCRRAGIKDLRFHDLRHEATSRFFELGLGVMEVAAIIGHKDLRMLLRYTHLRPEDLAKKLG